MYVQSAFEWDSGLQHCKAKANDYTLLPLLQNTAGKYLSHPLVRNVDQLFGVCTLTGVFDTLQTKPYTLFTDSCKT